MAGDWDRIPVLVQVTIHSCGEETRVGASAASLVLCAKEVIDDAPKPPAKKQKMLAEGEVQARRLKLRQSRQSRGVAWFKVLHIIRKHKGSRRPSSWRQETITCSKEEALGLHDT